jgi:hypothetical protein
LQWSGFLTSAAAKGAYVRVEHVHVNSGGQAVIGNIKKQTPGDEGVT